MSYIVALCSSCTFFSFLGFIIRVHCVGLLWGQDVYVAGAAITIRLKPCPAIRVLSAMETQAVTELGYTTPSQLGWGVLRLKRTHQWKRVRDSEREKNRWRETELKIHKDSDRERETERETNKDWDRKRDRERKRETERDRQRGTQIGVRVRERERESVRTVDREQVSQEAPLWLGAKRRRSALVLDTTLPSHRAESSLLLANLFFCYWRARPMKCNLAKKEQWW